jgi:hypothetical protein
MIDDSRYVVATAEADLTDPSFGSVPNRLPDLLEVVF